MWEAGGLRLMYGSWRCVRTAVQKSEVDDALQVPVPAPWHNREGSVITKCTSAQVTVTLPHRLVTRDPGLWEPGTQSLLSSFLQRVRITRNADRSNSYTISVCLSVIPSHSGVLSRRMKIRACGLVSGEVGFTGYSIIPIEWR